MSLSASSIIALGILLMKIPLLDIPSAYRMHWYSHTRCMYEGRSISLEPNHEGVTVRHP